MCRQILHNVLSYSTLKCKTEGLDAINLSVFYLLDPPGKHKNRKESPSHVIQCSSREASYGHVSELDLDNQKILWQARKDSHLELISAFQNSPRVRVPPLAKLYLYGR